ncbi:BA14K family protein [Rhizobium halophilum]|uniref:BA14K family protein n=1 Tax=Rhizobium halophilum TaxID=2846852 RepID=UPI001EFDCEB7|nr:BA14K family protein [Rhizobium halophilum]MCF6369812.1 BA14K family protein [Rhizobium halophilum]
MIHLFRKVAVVALSATVMAGAVVPAQAMPVLTAPAAKIDVQSDVTEIRHRGHRRGYYHGHRGYRHYRHGHRYHGGYWYPLAAFGAGALIGGAIAAPRYVEPAPAPVYRTSGLNPRHYDWCHARYRSYDSYSNTFQPYHGPRQTCYSPYY